ncbi:MAG: hypothetical protein PHW62_06365 [Candidatus Ratteibacteria bacterium]|nr:hypothetical protein [Candidatus Ratteibacteria bacterium]
MFDYTERREYNKRYKERKETGCPGWADEKSYEKKQATIEKLLKIHHFPPEIGTATIYLLSLPARH